MDQNHVQIKLVLQIVLEKLSFLLQKIAEMLQYGLTYTMRTSGCFKIPHSNVRMSDLAQFDIPKYYTLILLFKLLVHVICLADLCYMSCRLIINVVSLIINVVSSCLMYHKIPYYSDTKKLCCKLTKIQTKWFYIEQFV